MKFGQHYIIEDVQQENDVNKFLELSKVNRPEEARWIAPDGTFAALMGKDPVEHAMKFFGETDPNEDSFDEFLRLGVVHMLFDGRRVLIQAAAEPTDEQYKSIEDGVLAYGMSYKYPTEVYLEDTPRGDVATEFQVSSYKSADVVRWIREQYQFKESEDQELISLDLDDLVRMTHKAAMERMAERDLLTEVAANFFKNNTDPERIRRAVEEVRTRPPNISKVEDGMNMLEYNFKAYPSTEFKRHWGYLVYDPTNMDVKEMFCDCKDFFYRLYAPMVKAGVARWDLGNRDIKYVMRLVKRPNRQWTVITNPTGELFVCKHLYALLQYYLVGGGKVGKAEEPKETPPPEKKLTGKKLSPAVRSAFAAKRGLGIGGGRGIGG